MLLEPGCKQNVVLEVGLFLFLCFDGGKKRVESEFFLPAAPLSALSLSLSLSLFLSRSAAADPYLGLPGVVLGLVARLYQEESFCFQEEREDESV